MDGTDAGVGDNLVPPGHGEFEAVARERDDVQVQPVVKGGGPQGGLPRLDGVRARRFVVVGHPTSPAACAHSTELTSSREALLRAPHEILQHVTRRSDPPDQAEPLAGKAGRDILTLRLGRGRKNRPGDHGSDGASAAALSRRRPRPAPTCSAQAWRACLSRTSTPPCPCRRIPQGLPSGTDGCRLPLSRGRPFQSRRLQHQHSSAPRPSAIPPAPRTGTRLASASTTCGMSAMVPTGELWPPPS